MDGVAGGDSSWVARTEGLQLATPPAEGGWEDYDDLGPDEMMVGRLLFN